MSLQLNETITAGTREPAALHAAYEDALRQWRAEASLGKKIAFANDSMTIQLAEMFQHLHDIDSGDLPVAAVPPALPPGAARSSAAFTPSIGPSTHSNPLPTLAFQMKALYADDKAAAEARLRDVLQRRHGFSLWVGPSQSAAAGMKGDGKDAVEAGVYVKGKAAPGAVIALYPGAVYNGEMLQKALDCGHLGNPAVPRVLVPRHDDAVIDVHGAGAPKTNPYALAHVVKHPPPGVAPNVMRLQYDFMESTDGATGIMPFPLHLRDYIPNAWGSDVSMGQQLYGMLEQAIWVKVRAQYASGGRLRCLRAQRATTFARGIRCA